MDPITLALAGFSAAISGIGSLVGGRAEEKAAKENARILDYQARQREFKASFDADVRRKKAAYDIELSERNYARKSGTNLARAAASGIDLTSFTAVLADDAMEASMEVAAIRWQRDVDVFAIEYQGQQEAYQLRHSAAAQTAAGKNARIASYFDAAAGVVNAFSGPINSRSSGSAGVSTASPFSIK